MTDPKHKLQRKRREARRRAEGLCVECSALSENARCPKCMERRRLASRRRAGCKPRVLGGTGRPTLEQVEAEKRLAALRKAAPELRSALAELLDAARRETRAHNECSLILFERMRVASRLVSEFLPP